MENNHCYKPSLSEVLKTINECLDDFAEIPAISASDKGTFGDYPLHKVAIWGNISAAKVLLENGASVDAQGEDGDTALHRAVAGRKPAMVEFLLSRGANAEVKNRYGNTARDDAKSSSDSDIISAMHSIKQD